MVGDIAVGARKSTATGRSYAKIGWNSTMISANSIRTVLNCAMIYAGARRGTKLPKTGQKSDKTYGNFLRTAGSFGGIV
jgi:hypothetical protein